MSELTKLGLNVDLAFFIFAGDITYIVSHDDVNTVASRCHVIASIMKAELSRLGLKISPTKSYNFLANPFVRGRSLSKLSTFKEGEAKKKRSRPVEEDDFAYCGLSQSMRVVAGG